MGLRRWEETSTHPASGASRRLKSNHVHPGLDAATTRWTNELMTRERGRAPADQSVCANTTSEECSDFSEAAGFAAGGVSSFSGASGDNPNHEIIATWFLRSGATLPVLHQALQDVRDRAPGLWSVPT